jgi:hypothetical protein
MPCECHAELSLDVSLRSHLSLQLHRFVAGVVDDGQAALGSLGAEAEQIERDGDDLRITRDLDAARDYLRERYHDHPAARFGLLASSRDRDLPGFGVDNDFQSTRRTRYGPWYGDAQSDPGSRSCRLLVDCVTEFAAQGLELDAALLAWGTDFRRQDGSWNIGRMRSYARAGPNVLDPGRLRANAYRVLLTRARDATVVFVPPLKDLDETHAHLVAAGFRPLAT